MTDATALPPELEALLAPLKQRIDETVRDGVEMSPLFGGGNYIARRARVYARLRSNYNHFVEGCDNILNSTFGEFQVQRMQEMRRAAAKRGIQLVEPDDLEKNWGTEIRD